MRRLSDERRLSAAKQQRQVDELTRTHANPLAALALTLPAPRDSGVEDTTWSVVGCD